MKARGPSSAGRPILELTFCFECVTNSFCTKETVGRVRVVLLCNYINLSDEPNIIRKDKQLLKQQQREHNKEVRDSSLQMGAISQSPDDTDELSEIQIYTDTQNVDLKTRIYNGRQILEHKK